MVLAREGAVDPPSLAFLEGLPQQAGAVVWPSLAGLLARRRGRWSGRARLGKVWEGVWSES